MSAKVSFRELNALLVRMRRETRRVRNEFSDISRAFNVILASPNFAGRTKDAIDEVIRNMHLPIIVGIYESHRLFIRHLERAINRLSTHLRETDERGVMNDVAVAEFERRLSRFSQAQHDFDQEFKRIYRRIDEYLDLGMPRSIGYDNSRDGLAHRLSTRRKALRTFRYDTSELEDLYSQTKRQVRRLSNTVNLPFTNNTRLAVSRQTDFRSFINELHGREVRAQEERIQRLLNQWEGQDPATILVNLPRPLSEEAQIAWVIWTGSTQMLTPEEREMLGGRQAGSGAWRIWGGVAAIVLTGGKALPFKIAGAALGGYSVVSGGFDVAEGVQNMWLGSRDDVTTYAVNPLLDTVFGGNRELYQNVNMFIGMSNWVTISTAHMMPDQRVISAPMNPDQTRTLPNGQTLRSSNNFTSFQGNIQNTNVPRMININGQWELVQPTVITVQMEEKILFGHRVAPPRNRLIGGHSPDINNEHPNFAVETIRVNPDGTSDVQFTTQFPDGNLAKLKTSTLFPDRWSNNDVLDATRVVGNTPSISVRASDGATWHRGVINGVEIDVIKLGNNVISSYPTGTINSAPPSGFTR